jgi:hypothetical protein
MRLIEHALDALGEVTRAVVDWNDNADSAAHQTSMSRRELALASETERLAAKTEARCRLVGRGSIPSPLIGCTSIGLVAGCHRLWATKDA